MNSPLITVECALQYSLDLPLLVSTYSNFSTAYNARCLSDCVCGHRCARLCTRFGLHPPTLARFVKIAKNIIQSNTGANNFTTAQFYSDRRTISNALFNALVAGLAPYGATVQGFQARAPPPPSLHCLSIM